MSATPITVASPAAESTATLAGAAGGGTPALTIHALFEHPASNAAARTNPLMEPILRRARAAEPIAHRAPRRRRRRRLDQDALAVGAVELAQRRVQTLRVGLRVARHAQPEV